VTATARIASPTAPANLIAPDTSGMNFYRADPALADLLRIHLPGALFAHIEPPLDRLGALAGGPLDECARMADKHVPVLHQRDRFGRDAQWIEYHPAYRELENAAFGEFGIHAMSHRKGILGWPQAYPVAANPRIVAGADVGMSTLKCALKPLDLDDYPAAFTEADRAKLRQAFPAGVCDYGRPGIGQEPPSGTWIDYTR